MIKYDGLKQSWRRDSCDFFTSKRSPISQKRTDKLAQKVHRCVCNTSKNLSHLKGGSKYRVFSSVSKIAAFYSRHMALMSVLYQKGSYTHTPAFNLTYNFSTVSTGWPCKGTLSTDTHHETEDQFLDSLSGLRTDVSPELDQSGEEPLDLVDGPGFSHDLDQRVHSGASFSIGGIVCEARGDSLSLGWGSVDGYQRWSWTNLGVISWRWTSVLVVSFHFNQRSHGIKLAWKKSLFTT